MTGTGEPAQYIYNSIRNAFDRFETEFGVDMTLFRYWNFWNVSDINPTDNCSWAATQDNDIVIGWLHGVDHNGLVYPDGMWNKSIAPYCLCSDTTIGKPDWPHDSIVQHEVVSHLFDADDQGTWGWEHTECIMNYYYAWKGIDMWCSSCRATVNENIWGD